MLIRQPEQNSKRGSALLMVLLAGVLIILIGAGMLFFYQKQVERRVLLEFDIHRKLAAKSGFALVQYSGTGTYVYAVASNRPVILVTVGEPEPIYKEDFQSLSNWVAKTDGGGAVDNTPPTESEAGQYRFSTTSTNIGQRNELVFAGTNDVAWNRYPFGLCYEMWIYDTDKIWAGYVYVGNSNAWVKMFTTNATASLTVFGEPDANRRLELYEHTANTIGSPTNDYPSAIQNGATDMGTPTQLYMDRTYMAIGVQVGEKTFTYTGATNLPIGFAGVSNVLLGVGGFNQAIATNETLVLNKFEVRNPYKYEIYLSWTNQNRFLGATNTLVTTNVLATVVDATPPGLGKIKYYFFDSFRTIVEE